MVNLGLAVLTTLVSLIALGILVYAVFSKPDFSLESNENSSPTPHAPSRLSNNLIHPIPHKDHVIDLKAMGMETNEIVPIDFARNNREIEAELHLEIEQAIVDSDSNTTVSSTVQDEVQEAHMNLTTVPSSTPEASPTPVPLVPEKELSTIEPPFEKVLAFPDCKRTKDGRKFC